MKNLERSRRGVRGDRDHGVAAKTSPGADTAGPDGGLAQRLGNQGMQSLLGSVHASRTIQTKLSIGASDDPLEHEADRVADQLTAAPVQSARTGPLPSVQRFTAQPSPPTLAAPESVEEALARPGSPLDASHRQNMEQRFGADFAAVRVHTGSAAEQSAQDLGAQAYTAGNHIVFGAGQFAPQTPQGQRLLAHELTHVVQQSGATTMHANHGGPLSKTVGSAATSGAAVRRAIKPEDVAIEMVGREFELAGAFTSGTITLAKGTRVTAITWVNADTTVMVLAP